MIVKVKKLTENASLPIKGTDFSAGFDLVATSSKNVAEGSSVYVEYGTGLAIEIPEGYCGLIFPRSSVTSNTSLVLGNAVGLIDSDYRNEIKLRFRPINQSSNKSYKVGEKVGQLVIMPYPKIEYVESSELNDPKTRFGGFGSTDIK